MLENKFKIWDKVNKIFAIKEKNEDNYIFFAGDFDENYEPVRLRSDHSLGECFNNPDLEVRPYSGVKDIDGKELYHGDKVRFAHEYDFDPEGHEAGEDGFQEFEVAYIRFGGAKYPAFDLFRKVENGVWVTAHDEEYNGLCWGSPLIIQKIHDNT